MITILKCYRYYLFGHLINYFWLKKNNEIGRKNKNILAAKNKKNAGIQLNNLAENKRILGSKKI